MDHERFEQKVEMYLRERKEENTHKKLVKKLLCLAYAHAVKSQISELFTCTGCKEEQSNQQGHDFVMLTTEDVLDIYFDEALKKANHYDRENMGSICNTITRSIITITTFDAG